MKMPMMCGLVLGCATLMGANAAKAQGADQDKQFLMTASQSDYTEITFSQLALQQGTSPAVKKYAQKMVTDHQMLEQQMQPIAAQMGVTPVTTLAPDMQTQYDQLKALSGTAFDKQYMTIMDTSHHQSLTAFQTELSSTQNAQMKPTVKKGEKVVAEHTKMADAMVKKMGGTASGM